MGEAPRRILTVSTADRLGGADGIARGLFQAWRRRGMKSWMVVGVKRTEDSDVFALPGGRGWTWRLHERLSRNGPPRGWRLAVSRAARALARPGALLDSYAGREDFRFPETARLLELAPERPDLVHAHNLHGGYFDLRELPRLSREVPVVVTLHDAWLLSGHCAHSFDCDRWKTGCGDCPDLTIYPAVRRDATAYNWERKRDLFRASKLHVATPCRWLMNKVDQSILAPAAADRRVIPYGIDLSVFRPGSRTEARAELGLPPDAAILLFAAVGIRRNPWKDFSTLRAAIGAVAERVPVSFLALGEDGPSEKIGRAEIRFLPFETDPARVARYYQATDLYLHAARADTFPNTVLEALACGTPVVATAVGGIPEQVRTGETGLLTPPGDPAALASAIGRLLADESFRRRLGEEAARDARARFDLELQADRYLDWYREILDADPCQPGMNVP